MNPPPEQLDALVAEITATAARPQRKAITLPRGAYVSDDFHSLERERVLKRSWIAVEHVSRLPEPGNFANVDLFGEPLVVVRGKDGVIRVLSRICRHRGMDMASAQFGRPQVGKAVSLLCPYHLWTYDLTGRLVGATHMSESEGFRKSDLCLPRFRSETWLGFVWVTFDATLPPVAEYFDDLEERLSSWRPERLRVGVWLDWDCAFDWKLLVDNFMEPYHHIGAHPNNFGKLLPAAGCWTEDEQSNYLVCHLPVAPQILEETAGSPDPGTLPDLPTLQERDRGEWKTMLAYPVFLVSCAPDKFYWYRLLPTGAGRMQLATVTLFDPSLFERPDAEAILEREREELRAIHMEDVEVCTATQSGIASASYAPGPLSHLEKPVWLFQRYLARQLASPDAGASA